MKKTMIVLSMALSLGIGVLSGCGAQTAEKAADQGEPAAAGTEKGSDQGEPVTLRFSWWGGDERREATLAVIEQFEQQHPNITIEAEYGSSDGYSDKLATQLASGTAPDIMQIDPGIMPGLVSNEKNYFVDLLQTDFDFSNFEENYYKQRINGNYDGKQLGIPTGISGAAMLVNQGLAQELGLDFSKQYTWEDLFDWAKLVKEKDDTMYLMCSNKEMISNIVANNYAKQLTGTTFIDEETKKINFTKEQWTQVYSFVQRLYDEGVVAPASYSAAYSGDSLQSDPNWIAGKYVCCLTYMSTMETVAAGNPDASYSAGQLPLLTDSDTDGWSANCPQLMAVNADSEHSEEAVQFLDYFFNSEEAAKTLGCTRSVPPTAMAREICTEAGSLSSILAQAADVAGAYSGLVDDSYFSTAEAKQILTDEVEAVGFGAVTPEAAAEESISLLENYLAGAAS